ncbi:DUF1272 domain-containing protein [Microbulbifer spongiae]|uniref:DUF1272 domain-containing protein n=1 Tax=Microbulbifer spongiae TaxID=2944933 RepID=A0ABY9EDB9_9GAMM|nr:DUF1272 domain-containing protein [Microbulbifer sp. MI-G]WKD50252.1 DUF1272 domain-containing protein [Microbulbifer sp. MI-G]
MLALRPNCECCDRDLPANSPEAMICSYECTFCSACVEQVLLNVCPNCGGGFCSRPIRPHIARRAGVSIAFQPATKKRVYSKYSREEMRAFAATLQAIAPQVR